MRQALPSTPTVCPDAEVTFPWKFRDTTWPLVLRAQGGIPRTLLTVVLAPKNMKKPAAQELSHRGLAQMYPALQVQCGSELPFLLLATPSLALLALIQRTLLILKDQIPKLQDKQLVSLTSEHSITCYMSLQSLGHRSNTEFRGSWHITNISLTPLFRNH